MDKKPENKPGGPTDRSHGDKPQESEIDIKVDGNWVKVHATDGKARVEDIIKAAGQDPQKYNIGITGKGVFKPGQEIELSPGINLVLVKNEPTTVTTTQGVQRAVEELNNLGFAVQQQTPGSDGEIVVIPYTIPLGPHSGREIAIGLEVLITYNTNPPHWVHIPKDITLPPGNQAAGIGTSPMEGYMKWSRGPEAEWDPNPSIRTMEWYMKRHLATLWEEQCYAA